MGRKSGYYWTRDEGKWVVAEWDNDDMEWLIHGYELGLKDSDFEEIDPNPIVREERNIADSDKDFDEALRTYYKNK